MPEWRIEAAEIPESLARPRREANLLWYEPSQVLAATAEGGTVGAVRISRRVDHSDHGLITDLIAEEPYRSRGLAQALIETAEAELKAREVNMVEAVVIDGQELTFPFQNRGYIPFRKTVVLQWDLTRLKEFQAVPGLDIEVAKNIDSQEVAEFIFSSYQPYWQWWKETGEEAPIGRAEYPVSDPPTTLYKVKQRNWGRVIGALKRFNADVPQRMVIARKDGNIVGLCDAKADPDDSMDWGVLISRDVGGRAIGSALLGPALGWLRDQRLKSAQVTTTSGLDDYDPTVYLYVLSGGATIRGEFLVLRKTLA